MFRKLSIYFGVMLVSIIILLCFSNLTCDAENFSNKDLESENVKLKQQVKALEGTISMSKDALDELGVTTPNEAANIWAKGIQTRNGYLQYSVLCSELKKEFEEALSKSNRIYWVTGYSSPWVSNYDIVNIVKVTPLQYKIKMNFNWNTSIGHLDSTSSTILIKKVDNNWCISNIEWDEIMKSRIF